MQALLFVLNALFALVVIAFLLRVLMPLVRADFRNPLGEAVRRLTDPLVMPLRRVLKPAGKIDVASIVALLLVQLLSTALLLGVAGVRPEPGLVLATGLRELLRRIVVFYQVAIFVYALLSWIAPGRSNPASQLLARLCEPVLAPLRRVLPALGGLDLSPLIALIGLQAVLILLH
jgi:YggT family protein